MFIPNTTPQGKVGKFFLTSKDLKNMAGTLTAGSLVLVTDFDYQRGYDVQDTESGVRFTECGFDIFKYEAR